MTTTWRELMFTAKKFFEDRETMDDVDAFASPMAARKLQILLVEDDEPDAYLIRRALAGNPRVGAVVLAETGVEALALIDEGAISPDLAIIDLHMPRMDGLALLQDLATRERAWFPSVVLTSSASPADARRALGCGAAEFVTKPDTPDKLAAALDLAIRNLA
ncbi:MAG: response regulator [Roseiarcus sp.]|jgi:CheY-like chemotaxis protein